LLFNFGRGRIDIMRACHQDVRSGGPWANIPSVRLTQIRQTSLRVPAARFLPRHESR
jgi:hypothetical protein